MPHKDPEERAAYLKAWRAAHLADPEWKAKTLSKRNAQKKTPEGRAARRERERKQRRTEAGRARRQENYRRRRDRGVVRPWERLYEEKIPAEKLRARALARNAIKCERIIRPASCTRCDKPGKTEAHHYMGYTQEDALLVVFLCSRCHKRIDRWAPHDTILAEMTRRKRKMAMIHFCSFVDAKDSDLEDARGE